MNKSKKDFVTYREFDKEISYVREELDTIKTNHLAHLARDISKVRNEMKAQTKEIKGEFKLFKKEIMNYMFYILVLVIVVGFMAGVNMFDILMTWGGLK